MVMDIISANDQYGDYVLIPIWAFEGIKAYTKISPEDYEWVSNHIIRFWKTEHGGYAYRYLGTTRATQEVLHLHREILLNQGIVLDGLHVDHKNGDTLDNRRENIRPVTTQVNAFNRQRCNSNTGFKGVHKIRGNRYRASLTLNDVGIELGLYRRLEDAVTARDLGVIKYFDEHACTARERSVYADMTLESFRDAYQKSLKTSDFHGVFFTNGRKECWQVVIYGPDKVQYKIGNYFPSDEEAARAWDMKALELFGEKEDKLNFPLLDYTHGEYSEIDLYQYCKEKYWEWKVVNPEHCKKPKTPGGYKGVSRQRDGWVGSFTLNTKRVQTKKIIDEIEAVMALDRLKLSSFGVEAIPYVELPLENYDDLITLLGLKEYADRAIYLVSQIPV